MQIPTGHTLDLLVTSPDGDQWAATSESDAGEHAISRETVSEAFASVGKPIFVDANKAAFKVEDDDDNVFVLVGDAKYGPYARVTQLAAGGGHFAFLAKDQKRSFNVVADGSEGPPHKEAGDVVVSPDGTVAYWGAIKGKEAIFVDGEAVATGKSVSHPLVRNHALIGYLEAGSKWKVWHGQAGDLQTIGAFEWVTPPVANADGTHLAFGVRTGGRWSIWAKGEQAGDFDDVANVAISSSGEHVAFAAQENGAWVVVGPEGKSEALERVSTVEVDDNGRVVWVGRKDGGLFVGIGAKSFGPHPGLGAVLASANGSVYYRAQDGDAHALFKDGVAQEGRYTLLSNPVETPSGPVAHALSADTIVVVK